MPELVEIKSTHFTAKISTLGAELKSVKSHTGTEFMWQADADIWPRTAPVLFPIVGKVKNDLVRVNGTTYGISQHGFARDKNFSIIDQSEHHVKMQLLYDDDSLKKYPFDFKLTLSYSWVNEELVCGYLIENVGAVDMPFSIGAHPGFVIPEGHFEGYEIRFEKEETAVRYLLDNGLFTGETELVLDQSKTLTLTKDLFDKDAIVFRKLMSDWVELINPKTGYTVKMTFAGFPDFGIWAKKGTQRFVCLEPWIGHADGTDGHEDLVKKPGVRILHPHATFIAEYRLGFSSPT